jgi:hypothetical protein
MRILVLSLIAACGLSGCATKDLYLPSCSGQISIPQSQAAPCMTNAEYYTARKKAKLSQDKTTAEPDKEIDPRYKEWVP